MKMVIPKFPHIRRNFPQIYKNPIFTPKTQRTQQINPSNLPMGIMMAEMILTAMVAGMVAEVTEVIMEMRKAMILSRIIGKGHREQPWSTVTITVWLQP